jgi:hypothetical protein
MGVLVSLSGGAAAFFPPWMPSRALLGGLWPPLLAMGIALCAVAFMRGSISLAWSRFADRLPARIRTWIDPNVIPKEHAHSIDAFDWLVALGLAIAQYWVLDMYRDFYNPENQAIGHDNYAFLSTAVAASSGNWELYMVDKRPLYGLVTIVASWFRGGDLIHGAVAVNMICMSLLQVPTILLGRLWAGRAAGLGAGIMLLGMSLFYPYAHEVASYPLYNLILTSVVLAVSWALFHPRPRTFLIAGLTMGLLMVAQVKHFTFTIPMIGLLGMSLVLDGRGKRLLRSALALGPMAGAMAFLMAYPVEFTPLNVLIMHHREEVHYEIPYTWEETLKPDLASPSPISHLLPGFARGGEFEAIAAVMMAPPNSDVVAAFPQDGPTPRWALVQATTIPPLPVRLKHNIAQADTMAPGLNAILFPLAGAGFLLSVFAPAASTRRRFGIPHGWWKAGVLLLPLVSCFGSLSLKFNLRYVFHAIPTTLVLFAIFAAGLARLTSRHGGALWTLLSRTPAVLLCVSMGIALYIRAPLIGAPVDNTVLKQAFFRLPPDARQLMGKGYRLNAAYLDQHISADTEIYDCTPVAMSLYRPSDPRLIRPRNGSERDKLCQKQLDTAPSDIPRVVVVTSIPEFFGPDAVTPRHAARAGWTLLYGYDMHVPTELGSAEALSNIGSGWIAIFTDTPNDDQLGRSMLDGASPSTAAMDPNSPTNPRRSAGKPAAGNP